MAEFTEVMRQARRLCAEQQEIECCVKCPMQGKGGCMVAADVENVDYADAEQRIMQWAAEHPEPVYPSWQEAWKELFPYVTHIPCPELYFGVECCDHDDRYCVACKAKPIPAEIAEKLGIKPKEG